MKTQSISLTISGSYNGLTRRFDEMKWGDMNGLQFLLVKSVQFASCAVCDLACITHVGTNGLTTSGNDDIIYPKVDGVRFRKPNTHERGGREEGGGGGQKKLPGWRFFNSLVDSQHFEYT